VREIKTMRSEIRYAARPITKNPKLRYKSDSDARQIKTIRSDIRCAARPITQKTKLRYKSGSDARQVGVKRASARKLQLNAADELLLWRNFREATHVGA
jgi:hypothetical protein